MGKAKGNAKNLQGKEGTGNIREGPGGKAVYHGGIIFFIPGTNGAGIHRP
jgi:hypothetical protein